MKVLDLIISKGMAVSKAQARLLVCEGQLKINGETFIVSEFDKINELEVDIKAGDKIRICRREVIHE